MEELTLFLFILGTVVYVNASLLQFPLSFAGIRETNKQPV